MLKYCFLYILYNFSDKIFCVANYQTWADVTIHCRDNDGYPVDWWYIYKPPAGIGAFRDDGRNFSYITSNDNGRWIPSRVTITRHSMLQRTLSPLYRKTYQDHMGAAIYYDRSSGHNSTRAYGLVMADVIGGLWMSHTIPEFPKINELATCMVYTQNIMSYVDGEKYYLSVVLGFIRPSWYRDKIVTDRTVVFPEVELEYGHLLVCISTTMENAGRILKMVKHARPQIEYHFVSKLFLDLDKHFRSGNISENIRTSTVLTRKGQEILFLSRPPGNPHCIYRKFAEEQGMVLDVYGQSDEPFLYTECSDKYSLRNIEMISIKSPTQVIYVKDKIDRSRWAISTAAHWQRRGGTKRAAYWTCVTNIDKQDHTSKGGLMMCMHHYGVWRTFDNLKVAEPECYIE